MIIQYIFRIRWSKFRHLDIPMAKLLVIELDSEGEEFPGFNVECKLQRGELAESESDITVLTVNMEDLSDVNVTSSESNKEVDVKLDSFS